MNEDCLKKEINGKYFHKAKIKLLDFGGGDASTTTTTPTTTATATTTAISTTATSSVIATTGATDTPTQRGFSTIQGTASPATHLFYRFVYVTLYVQLDS